MNGSQRTGRAASGVLMVAALCLLIPAMFLSFLRLTWTPLAIGVGLIMEYAGFRLALLMFEERQRLMEVGFFVFTYIWMGLSPFLQTLSGRFPWGLANTPDEWFTAEALVIVGIVAYECGLRSIWSAQRRKPKAAASRIVYPLPFRRTIAMSLASFPITLGLLLATGLWRLLFSSRAELGAALGSSVSGAALLGTFIGVPLAPCSLILLVMISDLRLRGMRKIAIKVLMWATVLLALAVFNPVANARVGAGSYLAAILVAVGKSSKRLNLYMGSLFIAGMILVFPISDAFRNSSQIDNIDFTSSSTLVDKPDFDAFQQVANTVAAVDHYGFRWGKQLLGAALFWFPRSIWDNKPLSSGQVVGERVGYKMTNLSCPLWAEFYFDFGFPGVVAGFLLLGYLSSELQRLSNLNEGGLFSYPKVLLCYLTGYQTYLLRGDLMNAVAYSSFAVLIIYITAYSRPVAAARQRLSKPKQILESMAA